MSTFYCIVIEGSRNKVIFGRIKNYGGNLQFKKKFHGISCKVVIICFGTDTRCRF